MSIENSEDDDNLGPVPYQPPIVEEATVTEDSEDVINVSDGAAEADIVVEDDDIATPSSELDEVEDEREGITYDQTKIDLRGETRDHLRKLINQDYDLIGGPMLDARVNEIGSWENIIYRGLDDESQEEVRIQEALSKLSEEDRQGLASRYKDPESGKTILRTVRITDKRAPNSRNQVSGDEALLAFENLKGTNGGGYRIPLYNSGISIDVVVPTGNDIQTMITNCLLMDKEMGASQGAHYFAYYDLLYKDQILNFIKPLIINSSYTDWRKHGALWSVIKLPDLSALVTTIAALCYKDGFENFVTRCTREVTPEHPDLCRHTETFTASIFDMIVTRFSIMSKSSIEFMTASRQHAARNTLTQIAKYQSELGFEGEKIKVGDVTFVMRIPTIVEYQEAGREFISDIINEIQGDNTDGHYAQFGFRYMRVFLPWVGAIEGEGSNGEVFVTSDRKTILRQFEKIDRDDDNNELRDALRDYINRSQLTYVGRPALPCSACGHVSPTPSGMVTLDPFSAFFTQALLYSKPSE